MAKGIKGLMLLLLSLILFASIALLVAHAVAVLLQYEIARALISALVGVGFAVKFFGLKINFD